MMPHNFFQLLPPKGSFMHMVAHAYTRYTDTEVREEHVYLGAALEPRVQSLTPAAPI